MICLELNSYFRKLKAEWKVLITIHLLDTQETYHKYSKVQGVVEMTSYKSRSQPRHGRRALFRSIWQSSLGYTEEYSGSMIL